MIIQNTTMRTRHVVLKIATILFFSLVCGGLMIYPAFTLDEGSSEEGGLVVITKASVPRMPPVILPVERPIKEISYLPRDYDWGDFWPRVLRPRWTRTWTSYGAWARIPCALLFRR